MADRWAIVALVFAVMLGAPTAAAAPGYFGRIEQVSGTVGAVSYEADLPQLGGGDPAVTERFNSGMRAALDDHLTSDGDAPVTITPGWLIDDEKSRVSHIGPGAVAGVLLLNMYFRGAAHPANYVSTTVIDARTAQPVMITDLFTDRGAGLTTLAGAVNAAMAADPTLAGQRGPDPVADQLADWVPSPDGVVVYVAVSHAIGDYRAVTVPWGALAGVLAPGMQQKLSG